MEQTVEPESHTALFAPIKGCASSLSNLFSRQLHGPVLRAFDTSTFLAVALAISALELLFTSSAVHEFLRRVARRR